jgi:putative ABC transport system permease protein
VQSAVSLTPIWGAGLTKQTFSIRNLQRDVRYDEKNVLAVDTTFFEVFSFPVISGDAKAGLRKPGGILLSASMARKYFGEENPIGKQLAINNDTRLLEVAAVFADVPATSHFHFDFLVSYVTMKAGETGDFYTWRDFGHYNYVKLKPGSDAKALEGKLMGWIGKYVRWSPEDFRALAERNYSFRLQPLTDIHLRSNLRWELEPNGNIDYVRMMTAAALLILVIACVNFINLTTALSTERAREIGVRKVLGAFRSQLAMQFVGESVVVALMAMVVAIAIIQLSMPFLSFFVGTGMQMKFTALLSVLLGMGILVGLVAGVYPSLYLSSVEPGHVLKGKHIQGPRGTGLRKAFTVFQFIASMTLICSSVIIYNQLEFIRNKSLGFDRLEVIVIPVKNRGEINPRIEELRTELLKVPGIKQVSASSNIPGRSFNQNPIFASHAPDHAVASSEAYVDYDFFNVLNIPFADGRPFARDNPADRDGFVINETAQRTLGLQHGTGEEITWDRDDAPTKGKVIGVVKDFNFQSLHEPVRPLIFRLAPNFNYVLVKVQTSDFAAAIASIESTWKKFDSRFEFEFNFLEDQLNQQYKSEQDMANILAAFSFLAAAIACFGLLGIAALSFRQKTKEIGVRKVLGATVPGLMVLLMKDFTRLLLIAIVIAVPITWMMMSRWLENFNFRTVINPLVFVGSGVVLILLAWITLSYLTLRVARVNPAETLRSE